MKKWEYKIVDQTVYRQMNEMGQKGWELMDRGKFDLYFKR